MPDPRQPVVLFDGDCSVCNRSVSFVLQHERNDQFLFAPLQSEAAQKLLAPHGVLADDLSSMLVLENGRLLRESDAVIRIAENLRAPFSWLGAIRLVPTALRNRAYQAFGKRRLKWQSTFRCTVLDAGQRSRFLDGGR